MTAKKASPSTATAEQLKGDLPERVAEADEKGYWGTVPDPTPNEAYTLAGVSQGQPTPETDPDLKAEALTRSEALGSGLREGSEDGDETDSDEDDSDS